jgi:OOP family OmpA-OmpF porin
VLVAIVLAPAAEGRASGSASASSSADFEASGDASGDGETRPMRKFAPERHMVEIGLWAGLLVPNRRHEFYDPRVAGHVELKPVAADLGFRLGYYPLRWLGGEFEVGVMPTRTEADARATLYAVRGHVVGQLPWWRLAPFLVIGGGGMGVGSSDGSLGDDIDASFHWGPGLKFFANQWVAIRLDLRHLVGARVGLNEGATSHFEALLGVSLTIRTKRKKQDGGDSGDPDGDGVYGSNDRCPQEKGVHPDGCPGPDRDGDGVGDSTDECPDEPGPAPSGCPAPDKDADGIADDDDDCVTKPETRNGYEDDDGCPDEVPKKLRGAVGVLPGITFETNSARISRESKPTLDEAVKTLKANPEYSVQVVGHTDDTGPREYNVELSQKRADAVGDYLAKNGVDRSRIETRGKGPDDPVAKNDTEAGRAENRRIEFKVRKRLGKKRRGGKR